MTMKSICFKRARISKKKFRQILRLFSIDLTANQMSILTGLSRNTVNNYLTKLRRIIAVFCDNQFPYSGQVEVDESWLGARRIKGKRGRGAYGKTIVFGIFKRNGHVYTEIVPDASRRTLQSIIRGKVALESMIYSDSWRGYSGLVDIGYGHFRVNHDNNEFAKGTNHINGIEGFWGFSKSRLNKFRGMNKKTFYLHLKECEFRFNYRRQDIYKLLLKIVRNYSVNLS